METDQARQMNQLQEENSRLKQLVADLRRLPLSRSQPFQASCLHPENDGKGEEMGRAIAFLLRFALHSSSSFVSDTSDF